MTTYLKWEVLISAAERLQQRVCSEQRAAAGSLRNPPLILDNEANGPKRGSQTPAPLSSQANTSKLEKYFPSAHV